MARKIDMTEEDYFDLRETADELAELVETLPPGQIALTVGSAKDLLDELLYSYEGAWENETEV